MQFFCSMPKIYYNLNIAAKRMGMERREMKKYDEITTKNELNIVRKRMIIAIFE